MSEPTTPEARCDALARRIAELEAQLEAARGAEPFLVGRGYDATLVRVSFDSLYSAWGATLVRVHDRAGRRLFPFATREAAMAAAKSGYGADFIL